MSGNIKLKQIDGGSIAGHVITNASGNVSTLKHNLNAGVNPTNTDDADSDYAVGSIWVNTTDDIAWMCVDATVGSAVWRIIGESDSDVGVRSGFDQSFFSSSTPYVQTSSGTPQVVGNYIFPGTNVTAPTFFKIIGSRNGAAGSSTTEVYDFTNSNVIATINYSASAIGIYSTTTLNNLPVGEAIFEFRIYTSGSKNRLHFVSFR